LFKAASLIEQNGVDVVHLSKLDQTVIRSIAKDDVSFEQITDDLKSDSNLESRIQPQLITEIVRVFNRDFTKVINDEVPFYKKIGVDKIENDEGVYNEASDIQLKLLTLLKLSYYNQILSRDDLVSPLNNAVGGNRNVNSNFSFQYNIYLARCGSTGNSLNFNNSIEQSFGQSCPTETATSVNLDLANVINSNSDFYRIDLLINTFVRGGHDRGHSENGTGSLSYNLNGTITIPKCLNPSECSQFVNLKTKPSNYSYPNSNLTYDNIALKINGQPTPVKPTENPMNGNGTIVDISKQDAVVELSITGSKSHVGACCFRPAEYQSLSLFVNTTIEGERFYRFSGPKSEKVGNFMAREKDIVDLDFKQIQEKFVLEHEPTGMVIVDPDIGVPFFEGPAAPNFGQPGGGWQVYINGEVKKYWFKDLP
jgi:hypothetical protein